MVESGICYEFQPNDIVQQQGGLASRNACPVSRNGWFGAAAVDYMLP